MSCPHREGSAASPLFNGAYVVTKSFVSVNKLARGVLDPDSITFLEGGCALIVGTVSPDGEPFVTRGWGLNILGGEPLTARLLLAAEDTRALELLGGGAQIAYTATDVPTLRSMQLKGRCLVVEAATDEDRARAQRYADAFFGDILTVDRHAPEAVDRLLPCDYAASVVTVEQVFDQTPGPGAGVPMRLL
jgi:hypothetical protein